MISCLSPYAPLSSIPSPLLSSHLLNPPLLSSIPSPLLPTPLPLSTPLLPYYPLPHFSSPLLHFSPPPPLLPTPSTGAMAASSEEGLGSLQAEQSRAERDRHTQFPPGGAMAR